MTKIVIDIFMYLFEGMLIFYYSNSLFKLKRNRYTQFVSIAISILILFAIYQLNITYLNAILFFVVNCFLFCFLYNISFRTRCKRLLPLLRVGLRKSITETL